MAVYDNILAFLSLALDMPSYDNVKEPNQRPEVNLGIQTDEGKMLMSGQREQPGSKKPKGKAVITDPAKTKATWPEDATNLRWIVVVLGQLESYCDKKGCWRQSGTHGDHHILICLPVWASQVAPSAPACSNRWALWACLGCCLTDISCACVPAANKKKIAKLVSDVNKKPWYVAFQWFSRVELPGGRHNAHNTVVSVHSQLWLHPSSPYNRSDAFVVHDSDKDKESDVHAWIAVVKQFLLNLDMPLISHKHLLLFHQLNGGVSAPKSAKRDRDQALLSHKILVLRFRNCFSYCCGMPPSRLLTCATVVTDWPPQTRRWRRAKKLKRLVCC